ncbi:4a-hydroxytetrahydrobiopterin dehydratase [Amycolatopsis sp. cmx-4-54]|uniref:4a-hydroxytetrahydrobiopterin dehydratase n=1 Tax=Amycolatopsis sp. cmx-4-54 TaxID=2790936 RepID=UPI00397CE11D
MAEILNDQQADEAVTKLSGWTRDGVAIERTAKLPSFPAAIAAVDKVAELAEAADHHPDIDIRWRTVTFRLSTHSAGGLTKKDFALASQIDEVLGGM